MFLRRERRTFRPLTWWRLGLLFLAAGSWFAGVMTARSEVTAAAIVVLLVALVLGVVERRVPGADGGAGERPGPPA